MVDTKVSILPPTLDGVAILIRHFLASPVIMNILASRRDKIPLQEDQ